MRMIYEGGNQEVIAYWLRCWLGVRKPYVDPYQ